MEIGLRCGSRGFDSKDRERDLKKQQLFHKNSQVPCQFWPTETTEKPRGPVRMYTVFSSKCFESGSVYRNPQESLRQLPKKKRKEMRRITEIFIALY